MPASLHHAPPPETADGRGSPAGAPSSGAAGGAAGPAIPGTPSGAASTPVERLGSASPWIRSSRGRRSARTRATPASASRCSRIQPCSSRFSRRTPRTHARCTVPRVRTAPRSKRLTATGLRRMTSHAWSWVGSTSLLSAQAVAELEVQLIAVLASPTAFVLKLQVVLIAPGAPELPVEVGLHHQEFVSR